MNFFIAQAHAQTAAQGPQGGSWSMLIMVAVMFIFFFFVVIRPQRQRQKAHDTMLSELSVGDEVSTNAGILGKVRKVDDNYVVLKVADSVELKFQKASILAVLPKGTLKAI